MSKRAPTLPTQPASISTCLKLKRITVNPLYPVLDESDECPGFSLPLVLFSSDPKDLSSQLTNPCAIDMVNLKSALTFELEIVASKGVGVSELAIEGRVESDIHGKPEFTTIVNSKVSQNLSGMNGISVRCDIQPPFSADRPLPWGIKGKVTWTFTFALTNSNSKYYFEQVHLVEIYAVTPYANSYKTRPAHYQGMPRAALEFYLVHARTSPWKTLKDYIASIVRAVHADTGYAYEVIDGRSLFGLDKNGGTFDVASWARNLRSNHYVDVLNTSHSQFVGRYVNCYDQAAAVWTGVTLALQSDIDAVNLVWRSVQPFGYIRPTRLVGWCHPNVKTNNPYFQGALSDMDIPFTPGPPNSTDNCLTGFWNYVFLQFADLVLDATCGPCAASLSLEDYLDSSIDRGVAMSARNPSATWYAHIHAGEPNTTPNQIVQACTYGGATASYIQATSKRTNFKDYSIAGYPDARVPYYGRIGVFRFGYGLYTKSNALTGKKAWEKLGRVAPNETTKWAIASAKLVSLGGSLAKELESVLKFAVPTPSLRVAYLANDWIHFSWVVGSPLETLKSRRVLVDLFILPNSERATDLFATHVFPQIEKPSSSYRILPNQEANDTWLRAGRGKGYGSLLCLSRNVFYKIEGLDNEGELIKWEPAVKSLFSSHNSGADRLVAPVVTVKQGGSLKTNSSNQFSCQCKLGDKVVFAVSAPNGFIFDYKTEHKWILVPLRSENRIGGNSATFEFLARNLGTSTLEFTACVKQVATDYVKSAIVTVTVTR
ncbi:Solute:Na+ symporter, SSS family [Ceratobasidium theobromae]|uniref:Solute:Na+ symporter, SSS family n=1 Tax=Ceratobasidium theobromae TaxID=1582974 RepID=A0A5N5QEH0_9AGAM|nr:Solute:Na+ symporter, SSS family [Ceratobasidium theobromae]